MRYSSKRGLFPASKTIDADPDGGPGPNADRGSLDGTDRRFPAFAGWVLAHLIAYAAVAISIRYLSEYFQLIEIAAIRSVGSLIISALILYSIRSDNTKNYEINIWDDIRRSLLHLAGSLALIWSVVNLPLAFVATVEFLGPLFMALIGWFFFRQLPGKISSFGLLMIIAGSLFLFHNQTVYTRTQILIPIFAVMMLTTTNLLLARLARTRRVSSIIFFMHAIQFPSYLLILTLTSPEWLWQLVEKSRHWNMGEWSGILASGMILTVAGFVTQAALATASRHGTILQLCAADVLRLPLIAAVGFALFNESLALALIVPGLVVMAGSIIASFPRQRIPTVYDSRTL